MLRCDFSFQSKRLKLHSHVDQRGHPITENTVELYIGMQFLLLVEMTKASQSCRLAGTSHHPKTLELSVGMRFLLLLKMTKASQSCRPMGDISLQKILLSYILECDFSFQSKRLKPRSLVDQRETSHHPKNSLVKCRDAISPFSQND